MADKENKTMLLEGCVGRGEDLNGLVDYCADSIVSKIVMDKKAGSITLFAFDKGQRLSEHISPYDATVQIVDGEGVFTIGTETVTVQAGQILIMPANVPHAVYAQQQFRMLLIMIRS